MGFDEKQRFRDCPWCGLRDAQMRDATSFSASGAGERKHHFTVLTCPRCVKPVIIRHNAGAENPHRTLEVWPEAGSQVEVEHVPDDVAGFFKDSRRVLDAGVPDAAAVQVRRTLEAAAAHFGHTENQLVKRIEGLITDGRVTKDFGDVLHLVRKVGNLGAHAGDERVDEPTAAAIVEFTAALLRNLFEIPHKLREITAEAPPEPA